MRILSTILLFLTVILNIDVFAQIQTSELPPSFYSSSKSVSDQNYREEITKPNLTQFSAQDAVEDPIKNIPWRFGALIPVNYTLLNAGEWNDNDNTGISTWKLKIVAKDALSINLNFNDFYLPSSAKLFIYNSDYSDVLGAITSANNKDNREFSSRPIKGSVIILELIVPENDKKKTTISINEAVYGYRDLHQEVQKIFNSSGGCNINVNCSEGDNWQDIKRSVAMITNSNNTRLCTGTLINNALQDSTPFFLTAAHCGTTNNSIFIFGYESPNCSPNTDGILSNSISGSTRKAIAVNRTSDFELRELSSTPPLSYGVFYAGWSNINTPSISSTAIHHPRGDVKKISIDNDAPTHSGYYSTGVSHWSVNGWEKGTTEGGSSGSPLFDQNQRITGQLEGGDAACGNKAQDYYGKFSHSWDSSTDTLRQLKHWLDPNSSGITVLNGLDPNPAANNTDLFLLAINGIDEFFCAQSFQSNAIIRNVGNNSIDSFYVDYQLNSGAIQSILHSTSLNRQEPITIQLPSLTPINGLNTFKINVRLAGTIIDQNLLNNSDSISFRANTSPNPSEIIVTLKTDNYGSETSWELLDNTTNSLLYNSSSYPDITGGSTYRDTLCVYNTCLRFNIHDSQGDGFNDPSGTFGNGFALITINGTDTLFFENSFFATLSTDTFCLQLSSSIADQIIGNKAFNVFPNPIERGEILSIGDKSFNLKLYSTDGKLITEKVNHQLEIPQYLSSGIYFLEISDLKNKKRLDIKKVLVQ